MRPGSVLPGVPLKLDAVRRIGHRGQLKVRILELLQRREIVRECQEVDAHCQSACQRDQDYGPQCIYGLRLSV